MQREGARVAVGIILTNFETVSFLNNLLFFVYNYFSSSLTPFSAPLLWSMYSPWPLSASQIPALVYVAQFPGGTKTWLADPDKLGKIISLVVALFRKTALWDSF